VLSWLLNLAPISKQVANTCFEPKASGVKVKASISLALQVKRQKSIRKSVGVHLYARKSSNFHHVNVQSSVTFVVQALLLAFCVLICSREAIFGFDIWRLASCFKNRSIGFQHHSCFQVHAMAFNPNAPHQFHLPIGVELASKTPT